jgi:hypothetical protein
VCASPAISSFSLHSWHTINIKQDLLRDPNKAARSSKLATKLTQKWLSNKDLEKWSAEFVARCGAISARIPLGKSVNGQQIWAVEISDKPGADEAEPNLKYIANMHGDEISGRCGFFKGVVFCFLVAQAQSFA